MEVSSSYQTIDTPNDDGSKSKITLKMGWLLLAFAIFFEVAGTVAMKYSDGFKNIVASVLIFVFYAASFVFMNYALQPIDLGLAYAVWSGAGIVATSVYGFFFFDEKMPGLKVFLIFVVVVAVVGLKFTEGKNETNSENASLL